MIMHDSWVKHNIFLLVVPASLLREKYMLDYLLQTVLFQSLLRVDNFIKWLLLTYAIKKRENMDQHALQVLYMKKKISELIWHMTSN